MINRSRRNSQVSSEKYLNPQSLKKVKEGTEPRKIEQQQTAFFFADSEEDLQTKNSQEQKRRGTEMSEKST